MMLFPQFFYALLAFIVCLASAVPLAEEVGLVNLTAPYNSDMSGKTRGADTSHSCIGRL